MNLADPRADRPSGFAQHVDGLAGRKTPRDLGFGHEASAFDLLVPQRPVVFRQGVVAPAAARAMPAAHAAAAVDRWELAAALAALRHRGAAREALFADAEAVLGVIFETANAERVGIPSAGDVCHLLLRRLLGRTIAKFRAGGKRLLQEEGNRPPRGAALVPSGWRRGPPLGANVYLSKPLYADGCWRK